MLTDGSKMRPSPQHRMFISQFVRADKEKEKNKVERRV